MAARKKICPRCKGTGIQNTSMDGKSGVTCIDCNGKGYVFKKYLKETFKKKIALEGIDTVQLFMFIPQESLSVHIGYINYQNFLKENFDIKKIVLTDEIKSRICPAYFESQFSGHKPVEGVLCSRNKKLSMSACPFEDWQRLDCPVIAQCWNAYEAEPLNLSLTLTPLEYEVLCDALCEFSSWKNEKYCAKDYSPEKYYASLSLRQRLNISHDPILSYLGVPDINTRDPEYIAQREQEKIIREIESRAVGKALSPLGYGYWDEND